MKILQKALLPFLPDNEALNKKPLHRLVKVLVVVWSVVIEIAILIAFFNTGNNAFNYLNTKPGEILKVTDTTTGVGKTITYEQLGQIVKQKYPQDFNDQTDYALGEAVFNKKTTPIREEFAQTIIQEAVRLGKTKEETKALLTTALVKYDTEHAGHDEIQELLNDKFSSITSFGLSKRQWGDSTLQSLIPLFVLTLLLFLPVLFYRIILYIATGGWNGKKL